MNNRNHHRRQAGPFHPPAGVVDRAAVGADPAEAGATRIPLGDGVGGDEAEGAPRPQEVERAAEEVGDEVGVAVGFFVEDFEPVEVSGPVAIADGVLPGERRIADDEVETGTLRMGSSESRMGFGFSTPPPDSPFA